MSFSFTLADRLDYLAHIGPGIEEMYAAYTRPFGEQRVLSSKGEVIPELPPALKSAWAAVELQAIEKRRTA